MNQNDPGFSQEFLNAFIDDQLDPDEKARAYLLLSQNEDFNRRVCEGRHMRDLMQLAFRDVGEGTPRTAHSGSHLHERRILALALLLAGIMIGWGLRTPFWHSHAAVTAQIAGASEPVPRPVALPIEAKVLFHLNSGSHRRMREVLDEAQNLLTIYQKQGRPAQVEIIANGRGINLLRSHHSPFAARIAELHNEYANLRFAACQNTIDRIEREQGVVPHLLPQAVIVDSGVAQIIRLQQRGWAYIRV